MELDVTANVEVRISLPGRMAEMVWSGHGPLAKARQTYQLRLEMGEISLVGHLAIEQAQRPDVHGSLFALEVEEGGIG